MEFVIALIALGMAFTDVPRRKEAKNGKITQSSNPNGQSDQRPRA